MSAPSPAWVGSESAQPDRPGSRARSESAPPRLQYRTPQEHAERLLSWIQGNIDLAAFGLVVHQDILVWYSEMCIETGWMERSWNPVGRAFDVVTTGGAKPYTWIITKAGKKVRRRHYPIPAVLTEVTLIDASSAGRAAA